MNTPPFRDLHSALPDSLFFELLECVEVLREFCRQNRFRGGLPQIEVSFDIDANRVLNISARKTKPPAKASQCK